VGNGFGIQGGAPMVVNATLNGITPSNATQMLNQMTQQMRLAGFGKLT
jgi:hypothetical protein